MIYRFSFILNPKLLILLFIVVILFTAGIFAVFFLGIVGIVVLGVAFYLDYHVVKFVFGQSKSKIDTDNSHIKFFTPESETISLAWDEIFLAGLFITQQLKPGLFLYCREDDKLLTIPRSYTDFDLLIKEVQNRTDFKTIQLSRGEQLRDHLKNMIG